jgi:hypothetical protein
MNLFYPSNSRTDGGTKATWVLDSFFQGWPGCRKIPDYVWNGCPSVFWGFLGSSFGLVHQHQKKRIPFLFSDMPYFGRFMPDNGRNTCYWRIIPNALHCNWLGNYPADRIKKINPVIRDWRKSGDHILVCPSSSVVEMFYGEKNWLDRTVAKLKQVTDRPIRVRLKPRANGLSGPAVATVPFEQDCKSAHAVVTLCSLAAVEAVCLGVPSFCGAMSAAAPVSELNIENIESPLMPDRERWLSTLAYFQYTEAEIANGCAWQFFQDQRLP